MKVSRKELTEVLSLSGERRYRYFIKRAADTELVYGLWNDGWALAKTDDSSFTFPIWPATEFAEACAAQAWSDYTPNEISIYDLTDELIPSLRKKKHQLAIFPTPDERGVVPSFETLVKDLEAELGKY